AHAAGQRLRLRPPAPPRTGSLWAHEPAVSVIRAFSDRMRGEARRHSGPIRRISNGSGRLILRSDRPSGQGAAQSGTSDTPNPRSTSTAMGTVNLSSMV